MKKIKVLLLVAECWRCDSAGGNTINNFFSGMDAEFAQIFNSESLPMNDSCTRYFRFTRNDMIKNFWSRKPCGSIFNLSDINKANGEKRIYTKSKAFSLIKATRFNIFLTLSKIISRYSNWKTKELEKFILDFDPDVIYAPCYADPFWLALTRYVKDLTNKKVVSYTSDDCYSLRQFSLSPIYWLNRFWDRHCLRKTYPYFDVLYSISEDEIEEMSPITKKDMKILRKGCELKNVFSGKPVNNPIKLIYAGGIYINRWKILARIGRILKEINKDEVKMTLSVYTQNTMTKKQQVALNDNRNIFCYKAVDADTLAQLYKESDLAIHCESFSLKNRLITRLSFSTKIVDCLASSCAVLAIAWEEHAGLKYLKNNDAAICVTDINEIEATLSEIVRNPDILKDYQKKAYACCEKNHNIGEIQNELYSTFLSLSALD